MAESFAKWFKELRLRVGQKSEENEVGLTLDLHSEVMDGAKQELERLVTECGMTVPDRGDLDDKHTRWRNGKPDYTLANLAYMKGKCKSHSVGSLELIVENLVKTWEMEATHKVDVGQWTTINRERFYLSSNNGNKFSAEDLVQRGSYNLLMEGCPSHLYNSGENTFESAHAKFKKAFPDGFLWEVLEVFTGPPNVVFTWRHWAEFTGQYDENQGDGRLLVMCGIGVAEVDDDLKLVKTEVFYKPEELLENLKGLNMSPGTPSAVGVTAGVTPCPFSGSARSK